MNRNKESEETDMGEVVGEDSDLIMAAKEGDVTLVETLLRDGADVNHVNQDKDTALTISAKWDHVHVAGVLLRSGTNVSHTNQEKDSALTIAARGGSVAMVTTLLNSGADVNHTNHNEDSPLTVAARGGHVRVVDFLLMESKVSVHVDHANVHGDSALIVAAREGHVPVVEGLIKAGAKRDHVNHVGDSALLSAARQGHEDIVAVFLRAGADKKIEGHNRNNALYEAAINGHVKTLSVLMVNGGWTWKEKNTALCLAAQRGHLDVVQSFLDTDSRFAHEDNMEAVPSRKHDNGPACRRTSDPWINLEFVSRNGDTALTAAVRNGYPDVACALVQHGAKITQKVRLKDQIERKTALEIALQSGYAEIVHYMFESEEFKSVDQEEKDDILISAAMSGNEHILRLSIDTGARVSNSGGMAVLAAAKAGHFHLMMSLVRMGASFTVTDKDGNAALEEAARQGNHEAVKFLLNCGVLSSSAPGIWFESAIVLAARFGHLDIVIELYDALSKIVTWDNLRHMLGEVFIAACTGNHMNIVDFCLSKPETHVNYTNADGQTSLTCASATGNKDLLVFLLKVGAEVCTPRYENQTSALIQAASKGHLNIVQILISAGARIDEISTVEGLETPLFAAINNGHESVAEYLLSQGADLNFKLRMGKSILHRAAENYVDGEMVRRLIEWECDPNDKDLIGRTPLTYACCAVAAPQVKALVDGGADVNERSPPGHMSYLERMLLADDMEAHNAVRTDDRIEIIKYLIKDSDRIHLTNELPLLVHLPWAVHLAKDLIHAGALPSVQKMRSRGLIHSPVMVTGTPFSLALCHGRFDLAKFYLSAWFLHEDDVYKFRHRQDVTEFLSRPYNKNLTTFVENVFSRPWTLASLSFIVTSTALGMDSRLRRSRVLSLNIPRAIKDKLLFRDPSLELPVEQWGTLDLTPIHSSYFTNST